MSVSVKVSVLPDCDIHKHAHNTPGVPASYDAKTVFGSWAYMCGECMDSHGFFGPSDLGTGKGQALVLCTAETVDDVEPSL